MLVLEGLVSHHRIVQLQFFGISGWGIDVDYCDIDYWVSLGNEERSSVISETVPKYCILDSLVDYEGYSLSSKGFLPAVVDIMVI